MVRTVKFVLNPHWQAHLAPARFEMEVSRNLFALRSFFKASLICASMFVWRRPWLERRPGERRPREDGLPRLGERGAMERENGEEPRNGCGEGGGAAKGCGPAYNAVRSG